MITPSIFIFFGIPGSGKSYLGRKFAEKIGAYFYEADDDYTSEMREDSRLSEEAKNKVNDNFYSSVVNKTDEFKQKYGRVVVASALRSNCDRQKFVDRFEESLLFVLVKPDPNKHLENIYQREIADPNRENLSPEELKTRLRSHLEKKQQSLEEPNFKYLTLENKFDEASEELLPLASFLK